MAHSCLTNNESIVVSALAPAGVMCSGHGTCNSQGLCECDHLWTGVSDFVNLEGYDCHYFKPIDYMLYGLALAKWIFMTYQFAQALLYQHSKFTKVAGKRDSKGSIITYWNFKPFWSLVPEVFIVCPLAMTFCVFKLATNYAVGYNAAMTMTFVLTGSTGFFVNVPVQVQAFENMVLGLGRNKARSLALTRKYKFRNYAAGLFYSINGGVIALIFLGLDADDTLPGEGSFWKLYLARNMFVVLFFTVNSLLTFRLSREAVNLARETNKSSKGKMGDSELERFLAKVSKTQRDLVKTLVVLTVMYVIVSVPMFWGFASIPIAVTFIKAGSSENPVGLYVRIRKGQENSSLLASRAPTMHEGKGGFTSAQEESIASFNELTNISMVEVACPAASSGDNLTLDLQCGGDDDDEEAQVDL